MSLSDWYDADAGPFKDNHTGAITAASLRDFAAGVAQAMSEVEITGADGLDGTGMPIVYYDGEAWPTRPASDVPVMWKSLLNAGVSAPEDADVGDEWQRRT